ncbi:MAG: hypothetical protein FRX49_08072 [Trebouxia sp. A1-2]|nr:MAG: hypothetical protein FRX49_08072 [Trebouxia sp. A1-2]
MEARRSLASQNLISDIVGLYPVMTAAIMPKAFKAGLVMLALLVTFMTFTAADCPDVDVRAAVLAAAQVAAPPVELRVA